MKKIIGILIMVLLITTSIIPLASSFEIINQSNLLPGIIDQEQSITTDIEWLEGGADNWQEFIPTRALLTEVEVHIGCYYSGSYQMTLTIEAGLGLTPITYATLDCSSMPNNQQGWVMFDVIDRPLNPGQKYYIVLRFDPGSEYGWSGSQANPYSNGESNVGSMWDYAFRTYTAPNNPPDKPDTPSGETSGKTGNSYSYSTSTSDSDGDQVYYWFDWGDGTNSGWDGPHNSGDSVSLAHTWSVDGTYPVKVKAKDTSGEESVWSDPLSVSMPKNKNLNDFNPWISRLIQRFLILEYLF